MKFLRALAKTLWHALVLFVRFIVYFSFFLPQLAERGLEFVHLWPSIWPFRAYRKLHKK